jgi:hypothetical protein
LSKNRQPIVKAQGKSTAAMCILKYPKMGIFHFFRIQNSRPLQNSDVGKFKVRRNFDTGATFGLESLSNFGCEDLKLRLRRNFPPFEFPSIGLSPFAGASTLQIN